MSEIHLEGEIKAFYGDIKATSDVLSYERENFAKTLKNGLGDEIKKYIDNPPKPNYWSGLKLRFRRWWNNKKG